MSTFVSVGNATQPFPRLLDAVVKVATLLPQPVFVQYGSAAGIVSDVLVATAFIDMDEFEKRVMDARLLILHAGAGSVLHALSAGKIPVVMPRLCALGEHIDDHQLEFARELADLGKIVLCEKTASLLQAATEALQQQQQYNSSREEPALVARIRSMLEESPR